MRWDKEVESKLKEYPHKVKSLTNMQERINYLNENIYTLKPVFSDSDPIQGGACKQEDILLNKIVEKEELEKNLRDAEFSVRWIQKALTCLTDTEFKIIQQMYLSEHKINIVKLCEEIGYEKSQVYKIRNDALYKMTLVLYGKLYS